MSSYRISQAATMSGLIASALRFYEDAGVFRPPRRTPAGNREYGDADLDRLRFLARARELGLSLDEIRDLLPVWDGGTCATAKAQLRDLVQTRVAELDVQVTELGRLKQELQHAARPGHRPVAGRLRPGVHLHDRHGSFGRSANLTAGRGRAVPGPRTRGEAAEPVVACSLGASDLNDRMADWNEVLTHVQRRTDVEGGMRVALPADPQLTARAAELVALESQRCSFVEFTLTVHAPGQLLLTATGPAGTLGLAHELLGAPA